MHVCIFVCPSISSSLSSRCIYICTCIVYTHICTYAQDAYKHRHNIDTNIQYLHRCQHTQIYTCVHTHILHAYTHLRTHTHTYTHRHRCTHKGPVKPLTGRVKHSHMQASGIHKHKRPVPRSHSQPFRRSHTSEIQSDTIRYNPENGQVPEYGAAANNRLKAANNRLKVGDATSPSGQHNGNHYPTSSMPPPLTMAAANVRYARNNLGETRRRSQMHGAQWLRGLTLRQ